MSKFFVSCPLNCEAELATEIKSFWFEMIDLDGQPTRQTCPELSLEPGGVEFETADHLGFQVNFFSKIALRVLIRIGKFQARYFDQFEKGLKSIDLNKWLAPQKIVFKIESHKSRLNNQKNLAEAAKNVLVAQGYSIIESADDVTVQSLYIRLERDLVLLSLDSSGHNLHRRGYALHRGEAPLRENLAALVIRQLWHFQDPHQKFTLLDPFVGSGTLLFEALSAHWPLLNQDWAWLKFKNCPKLFQSATWMKNYRWAQYTSLVEAVGIDQDSKAIDNLRANLQTFKNLYSHSEVSLDAHVADSLKIDLSFLKNRKNIWLVTNPPYGHRLSEGEAVKVLERIADELTLAGLIVIHPESWKLHFNGLTCVFKNDFNNQGLKLKLSLFKR